MILFSFNMIGMKYQSIQIKNNKSEVCKRTIEQHRS